MRSLRNILSKFLAVIFIAMNVFVLSSSMFAPNTARAATCVTPWGMPVMEGQFVVAYYEDRPGPGRRCQSEMRFCNNGFLSGFYRYQNCVEDNGCQVFPWGYIPHMGSVTAYRNAIETGGRPCESQVRYCSYGQLSGWYTNQNCTAM